MSCVRGQFWRGLTWLDVSNMVKIFFWTPGSRPQQTWSSGRETCITYPTHIHTNAHSHKCTHSLSHSHRERKGQFPPALGPPLSPNPGLKGRVSQCQCNFTAGIKDVYLQLMFSFFVWGDNLLGCHEKNYAGRINKQGRVGCTLLLVQDTTTLSAGWGWRGHTDQPDSHVLAQTYLLVHLGTH